MPKFNHFSNVVRYGELISEVATRVNRAESALFQIKELCEMEGIELKALEKLDQCEIILSGFLKEAHEELNEREEEGK